MPRRFQAILIGSGQAANPLAHRLADAGWKVAAILSDGGAELVQTLMALMMADAPWTLFRGAVFIHPTMTEGFFALMDSVA